MHVRSAIKKTLNGCFPPFLPMVNRNHHPVLHAVAAAAQGVPVHLAGIEVLMDFINKNIMISGGSSGIGLALAKELAALGANITILARRKELLESALSEIRESALSTDQQFKWFSADVSNFNSLKRVLSADNTAYDILINSAGIAYPGKFVDMDPTIFKNVIDINYLGTVYLTKLILPKMIEKNSGYIVNISSLAALIGIYGYTAYAPSKYAVRGFSRCLRSEVKPHGIDVSVVLPPDTDTPQLAFEHSIIPEITKKINQSGSVMSAEKVAHVIIEGIKKKRFTIVPGFEGNLLYALAPIFGRYFYRYAVNLAKEDV
ncbi:MAG: SDR family oxidoreductase [Pelolinea sp.]|nr:SDR family oxidoreductase [Pelolinea sp.]